MTKEQIKAAEVSKEVQMFESLKEPMAVGEVFVKSGMFPDIKTQAQAVVKILAGREMGLTPFEAMNNLYIVNGKVAVMSNAMASIVKKSQKYDYKINTMTETECSIEFFTDEKSIGISTFTIKDAARAGIVNKEVWKSYPKNMLFARALSNGVRFYCPDAACGYSVEEMRDIDSPEPTKTIEMTDNDVKEVTNGES